MFFWHSGYEALAIEAWKRKLTAAGWLVLDEPVEMRRC